MRYKWIALVLACALLFCGCRQAETDWLTSDDIVKQTTVALHTNATTKRTAGTTLVPPTTRQTITCKGYPPKARQQAFTLRAYKSALSSVRTAEEIDALFKGGGYPEKVSEHSFKMLLDDRFFLIPVLEVSTISAINLSASGSTGFTLQLPDRCRLSFIVCHDDTKYSHVSGAEFKTADGNPFIHEHTSNEAGTYYMKVGDYQVSIHEIDVCGCKRSYIEKYLTFEKVEIK